MHFHKTLKEIKWNVKAAFVPKQHGDNTHTPKSKPKSRRTKTKQIREKNAESKKKLQAPAQEIKTSPARHPFGRFLAREHPSSSSAEFPQPQPRRNIRVEEHAADGDSAAPSRLRDEAHASSANASNTPNTTRSSTKTSTWSSKLSRRSSSFSIKHLFRRNSDTSQSTHSISESAFTDSGQRHQNRNSAAFGKPMERHITEERDQDTVIPRSQKVPSEAIRSTVETSGSHSTMSRPTPNLQRIREQLRERAKTSKTFNDIWEHKALPDLRKTLDDSYNGAYSVTIQFNYAISARIVEVMTLEQLPEAVDEKVKDDVKEHFKTAEFLVEVEFTVGTVEHSADAPRSSRDVDDHWNPPGNASRHSLRLLGDSVGCEGGSGAATLGPAIMHEGKRCWLVNWHLFDGNPHWTNLSAATDEIPELYLVHPAEMDCSDGKQPGRIAKLKAYSGRMYDTWRESRSLKNFAPSRNNCVVTDWAICTAEAAEILENRLRYAPDGIEFEDRSDPVEGLFQDDPKLHVARTTGRTSGLRYATVCETPSLMCHRPDFITREWYLENWVDRLEPEQWILGGPGVPGDSGAAVVDDETGYLVGQIWGRNKYGGDRNVPRITYFTHIWDIFDDIKKRYPDKGNAELIIQPGAQPLYETNAQTATEGIEASRFSSEPDTDGTTLSPSPARSRAHSPVVGEHKVSKSTSQETMTENASASTETHTEFFKKHLAEELSGSKVGEVEPQNTQRLPTESQGLAIRRSSAIIV
ncbi:hypothetical protein EsH8_VI_000857 [Colletotrichum jinshuiense]